MVRAIFEAKEDPGFCCLKCTGGQGQTTQFLQYQANSHASECSGFPSVRQVLWRADSRPPKLFHFSLGCRNAFCLALFDCQPLLLGNGPHHLNQDRTNLTYSGGSLQMRQSGSEHSYMLRGIRFSTAMHSMETVSPLSYPIFTHSVDIVLTADSFHRTLLYRLTGSPPGGSI